MPLLVCLERASLSSPIVVAIGPAGACDRIAKSLDVLIVSVAYETQGCIVAGKQG
jgi:hypothetical protein